MVITGKESSRNSYADALVRHITRVTQCLAYTNMVRKTVEKILRGQCAFLSEVVNESHVSLNITSTLLLSGLELEVTELKLKGWPD